MKLFYIYRITNLANGKTYIGQHKYKFLDDSYFGSGVAIKAAIKKYGKSNFKKEILYSRIKNQDTADSMEKFAISKERSIGKAEYNLIEGGHGYRPVGSWKKSEEWKARMSVIMRGKVFSDEHRANLSKRKLGNKNAKGRISSDEYRQKQRDSHLGKIKTEDAKQKTSVSCKNRMEPIKKAYADYKQNHSITWNEFQKLYKSGSL